MIQRTRSLLARIAAEAEQKEARPSSVAHMLERGKRTWPGGAIAV